MLATQASVRACFLFKHYSASFNGSIVCYSTIPNRNAQYIKVDEHATFVLPTSHCNVTLTVSNECPLAHQPTTYQLICWSGICNHFSQYVAVMLANMSANTLINMKAKYLQSVAVYMINLKRTPDTSIR